MLLWSMLWRKTIFGWASCNRSGHGYVVGILSFFKTTLVEAMSVVRVLKLLLSVLLLRDRAGLCNADKYRRLGDGGLQRLSRHLPLRVWHHNSGLKLRICNYSRSKIGSEA